MKTPKKTRTKRSRTWARTWQDITKNMTEKQKRALVVALKAEGLSDYEARATAYINDDTPKRTGMEHLLPCPDEGARFHKGKSELRIWHISAGVNEGCFHVECHVCGWAGPTKKTIDLAERGWNKSVKETH